jgi:exosortase A
MSVLTLTRASSMMRLTPWLGPMIAFAIGLAALGVIFRNEITAAIGVWIDSTAYNHCFLVLPIVGYLLWDRRSVFTGAIPRPMVISVLLGLPLAIAWLVADRLGIMEGRQLVAMSFVELLLFSLLGWRLWWQVAGPLLYLFFLMPFGFFVTPMLQDVTTWFVRHGLQVLHIPNYIDGYVIQIPEGTFLIAEACAGLRFLIAAIAFGCLYALLVYRSPMRRAVFIAVSIVAPIIANGFRALGIVSLGHYLGSAQAAATDHVLYGWIFFSLVILLLVVLGLPFREDHLQHRALPVAASSGQRFVPALVSAVVLALLAGGATAFAARLDRAAMQDRTIAMPPPIAGDGCTSQPAPLTAGLGVPGRLIVQRFVCGAELVELNVEVFSPRIAASVLLAEQRRLTGEGSEDAETHSMTLPNWWLISTKGPDRLSATSLWLAGGPAPHGLSLRARQALHSVFGSQSRPVLAVLVAAGDWAALGQVGRTEAERGIMAFLASHPELSETLARLSSGAN